MKVTLYSEPSIDGFIATTDHDTSWVFALDSGEFEGFIKQSDAILMGKQTFIFAEEDGDFPYKGSYNIVFTSDESLLSRPKSDKYLFTNKSPNEVIKDLARQGVKNIGVIGGGKLNGSMLKDVLIDELILTYHPAVLGNGKALFNGADFNDKLKLVSVKKLSLNLFQVKYTVNK